MLEALLELVGGQAPGGGVHPQQLARALAVGVADAQVAGGEVRRERLPLAQVALEALGANRMTHRRRR